MARKHLVLEEDVHEALTQRREMTGFPISKIGNSILRSHIAAALLEHKLGERLIEEGFVTKEQYQATLERVDRDLRNEFQPGVAPIQKLSKDRSVSGSWEIQVLYEDPMKAFQLLEAWARDALKQPMTQHVHEAEEFMVSLGGRCLVVMGGIPFTLTQGNGLRIPGGAPHSALPLDSECRLVVVTTPALSEYSPDRAL